HRRGVIHRDLKPGNIMVTGSGKLKVLDFGIARGPDHSRITSTGVALGTLLYMAPEQLADGTSDARSDQYQLGVIAYEMLTGRLPYPDQSDAPEAYIYQRLMGSDPPPMREFRPDVPPELDDTIRRVLSRSPAARFESVTALREAVKPGSDGA